MRRRALFSIIASLSLFYPNANAVPTPVSGAPALPTTLVQPSDVFATTLSGGNVGNQVTTNAVLLQSPSPSIDIAVSSAAGAASAPTLTFSLQPEPTPQNNHDPQCSVAGCSGQLCIRAGTEAQIIDTCEWVDSNVCYGADVYGWDSVWKRPLWGVMPTDSNGQTPTSNSTASFPLFKRLPMAYCGYNADNKTCSWLPNKDLETCIKEYVVPDIVPMNHTTDNYTCLVQGCWTEVCSAHWPGDPIPMYDCVLTTPETEASMKWARCLQETDCGKWNVFAAPEAGAAAGNNTKEAVISGRGCAWNPDSRPGLRECLEKNNWPSDKSALSTGAVWVSTTPAKAPATISAFIVAPTESSVAMTTAAAHNGVTFVAVSSVAPSVVSTEAPKTILTTEAPKSIVASTQTFSKVASASDPIKTVSLTSAPLATATAPSGTVIAAPATATSAQFSGSEKTSSSQWLVSSIFILAGLFFGL